MAGEKSIIGAWGEMVAVQYLRKRGYRIWGTNYRVRTGEIDIIATTFRYVVFVEVKVRRTDRYGSPAEFVGAHKQRRIMGAAGLWLQSNPTDKQPRFDVIELYAPQGTETKRPVINHIKNAFPE